MEVCILSKNEVVNLLRDVLVDEELDEVEIKINSGSEKGDGYLSILNTIDIAGKKGNYHYVVKLSPRNELYRKMMQVERFYIREIRFYKEAFPAMIKFQAEKRIKDPFVSVPKYLTSSISEGNELLVLENIRSVGFDLWDRRQHMDENHLKLIFREYGKLHAISYAMRDQKPEVYEKISANLTHFFYELIQEEMTKQAYDLTYDSISKLFTTKEEQPLKAAVEKFKGNLLEYYDFHIKEEHTFVLVHGDCWNNNMMFKYEDPANPKRPTQMRLLDFQLFCKASPVHDLSYFFYTAASESSLYKLNDYLRIYHESLTCHAKNLGTDIQKYLSYDQLRTDWKRYSKFGFSIACLLIRTMLTEKEEVLDTNTAMLEDFDMAKNLESKFKNEDKIQNKQKALVKFMFNNNFFN